jgi:ribosomal protein S18 acetylase RimI-like enzyme
MNIRPWKPSDGALSIDYPIEYDWDDPPKDAVIKVAVMQGIIGFVSYKFVPDQILEIQKLGVDPVMRRLKIGTELLHHVVQRAMATGSRTLRMTVPLSNTVGCYFLSARGFDGRLVNGQFIHFERNVILR